MSKLYFRKDESNEWHISGKNPFGGKCRHTWVDCDWKFSNHDEVHEECRKCGLLKVSLSVLSICSPLIGFVSSEETCLSAYFDHSGEYWDYMNDVAVKP